MKNLLLILILFCASSVYSQVEELGYGEPYEDVITKHFVVHQEYPKEAELYGLEGGLIVRVKINQKGELLEHEILKKSGYDILNKAVSKMVVESQPYPEVPMSYINGESYAEFIFPVFFGDDEGELMTIDEEFQVEVKKARSKK